jgi:hypothetical protein
MDSTQEHVRCALFAVGVAYMHALHGAPASPRALRVLEPAQAVVEILKHKPDSTPFSMVERFLSGISDAMWRQIQPFTILRALWWSSGWTLRLLFSLAKNLTYYAVSSAVGMVGAPFSLDLSLGKCSLASRQGRGAHCTTAGGQNVRWVQCTAAGYEHLEDSVWYKIRCNPNSDLGRFYKQSVQSIRGCVSDIYSADTILDRLLSADRISALLPYERRADGSFVFTHTLPMHVWMYWLQECMHRLDET